MATGNSFEGHRSVRGSEEDFHIVCLPCHRDGDTIAAFGYCCQCQEHLCADCCRYHKKPRPFKHHRLLDKDEMPDTQDLDRSIHQASSENLTMPCNLHKNEMLKLYCHDHKMLLCHICVALEHTNQCQVAYIPDISEQIINSQEYENVVERMDKVLTACASIKNKTSEDAENSKISMTEGLEEMRMLRQKIIDKFDKMEAEIENKIQALKQQNEDRQEEDESICNDAIKRVTVAYDSLNQLNASQQADLLFVELKQAVYQLQDYEKSISLLSTQSPIETYKFVPSSMISDLLNSEESWGDLTAIHEQHEASSSDQQPDQVREQTKSRNHQDQTVSSLTQQQQHASTSDQQPGQARDQTKPTNCQGQVGNTSTQQQKQRTSTLDQQQGQVINETKLKGKRTQATCSSDEQQQGKIEGQPTPTSQQAQPTNYQSQAVITSLQQQNKTRNQVKPNNNGTMAAIFSDQQQQGKRETQNTPTPQNASTNCQALAANTSSKQKEKTRDQTKPNNNGKQEASSSKHQQQGKTEVQPTPTGQKAKQMRAPSHDQVGDQIKQTNQNSQACNKSIQKQALVRAKTHSTSAQYNPVLRPAFDNIQATRHGTVYVKTSEDMWDCYISGMTTLPSGKLVLADRNNNAIKLVDIDTNKLISRLLVKSPWGITATSSTQVAVTVPDKQEIQFITATDKWSLSHKVKTNGLCYGVCYHENSLVVTYYHPGKLEIMNMQGKVMTSVQKYSTGEDIFREPDYVQANSNFIYVSDWRKDEVIMLNWQGEVTGRNGGLGVPSGLTLLHDGSLLVCERWKGTVYHVSGDGTNKRAVLQGVRDPQAIYVDDGGHTLYISRRDELFNTEDNNNILVYKL